MTVMPSWRNVTWTQRGLFIGIIATVLVFATRPTPTGVGTSTTLNFLLWATFVLNALLLLVLGPTAVVATRRWFREGVPLGHLRRQRRAVRRRAVLLSLVTYIVHQTLVVLLDPRFSLEWLTGRRRVFGPIVTVPDRLEIAWAFTAAALGYIALAWLLWRSAGVQDLLPTAGPADGPSPVLGSTPPLAMAARSAAAVETLPRDPVTGRVVRQFDL